MGKFHNKDGILCSDCKRCCASGDVKRMVQLLSSGCSVNARCDQGSTPLMIAAGQGHIELVDTLLSSWKPDVNSQDLRGDGIGNGKSVKACSGLIWGRPIADYDDTGNTALLLACKAGQWQCVRSLLFSWSADLDRKDNTGSTALIVTASCVSTREHLRCVQLLLEQDADVNVKNDMGMSALMYCVDSPHYGLALLEILVDAGADVDCVDYDGESLLMLAVRRGHYPIVDYLLNVTNVGVNSTNNAWDNVLIIALKCQPTADKNMCRSENGDDDCHSQIIDRLLKSGSDPNSKSSKGCTALSMAAASSFKNTVLLLSHGAVPKLSQVYFHSAIEDTNHTLLQACDSIFSPVDIAVLNGQFSTANFLLNFVGCRPYCLLESYGTIPLNLRPKWAGHLRLAVGGMISKADQCPGWVDMVRDCLSQPRSLLQLCTATVSHWAGATPHRHHRLTASGLPSVVVRKLFVFEGVDEENFLIRSTGSVLCPH